MTGYGDSTRCVRAGAPLPEPGAPFLPGPVFAAPYHLSPDEGTEPHFYARASNPGWTGLEAALAELEGGEDTRAVVTGSGMAAITVGLRAVLRAGDLLVLPSDGYYQVRAYAAERLVPMGVRVREVPTPGMVDAVADARLVLAETPSNPGLDVVDLAALAAATHAAGGLLAVDNTTATPLAQQPLQLGADLVVASGTKALSGHSDLLMGYLAVSTASPVGAVLLEAVQRERLLSGSVLGPFETWLAHRSLGSAALRVRQQARTAGLLAPELVAHRAVGVVRYPGLESDASHRVASRQMRCFGGVLSADLGSAEAVRAFVAASELVTAATSFGGLHTTVDRRARWGDAVGEGFLRLSCGIEDTDDVVTDVLAALDQLG